MTGMVGSPSVCVGFDRPASSKIARGKCHIFNVQCRRRAQSAKKCGKAVPKHAASFWPGQGADWIEAGKHLPDQC